MDLRGKRIEEGYTNLVTVEGDSVASSGKLQNGQGTDLGNIAVGGLSFNSGDGELQLPAGTTAERPASPSAGYARFNTDKGKVEIYTGAAWLSIALEGAVQLSTATATVTGQDAVAELGGFISQFGTPASAFSVRKLGDTDVCMRVRRSSDNAEQNIGFDGDDLDESALTTFVGANDGFVTTWYDQSVDNSTLPAEHGGGATASYSLRLVDSTYTGDAIRVRRSSDNTEQDIGFVDGELDTSSLETFCSGTNGFVTTWYDQSGSNDATQATAGSQPQIVSSGSTILENGKPALDFDGTDDNLNALSLNGNQDMALFHIFTPDTLHTGRIFNNDVSNTAPRGFLTGIFSGGTFSTFSGNAESNGGSYSANEQMITSFMYDDTATTMTFFKNSETQVTDTSFVTNDVTLQASIGFRADGTSYYNGTIQEVVLHLSDQSANRESIELNQASYYDIGVSIGATQSTAGSQPKIVSSGTVIKENSVPALDFDGSDDTLNTSYNPSFTTNYNFLITSVSATDETADTKRLYGFLSTGSPFQGYYLVYKDLEEIEFYIRSSGGVESNVSSSSGQTGQKIISATAVSGSNTSLHVDGALIGSLTAENISGHGALTIGAENATQSNPNNLYDGTIQELVFFDTNKSSDRTDIESNIATYYNITI